jgi:hypothetical protein
MDTTMGIERDLRRREGLLNAKARIVQAKSDLLNRNANDAAKELTEAIDSLESATESVHNVDPTLQAKQLVGKLRQIKMEIAVGKKGVAARLDTVQKEVDTLLNR